MKKIIIMLLVILFAGCSSSATGSGDYPPTSGDQTGDDIDVDITDSILPPAQTTADADGWYIVETDDQQSPVDNNETESAQNAGNDSVTGNTGSNNTADSGSVSSSSDNGSSYAEQIDPSSFDVKKLNFEEFDNLYGQITYNGVPEERESQPLKNANGIWRYNLKKKYDDPSQGYMYDELGYAHMYVKGSDQPPIRITLYPRKASDGYEAWDLTDESVGYEPFTGNIDDDNIIRLKGNNAIIVPEYYYAYQGKEYLIAKMWLSEEDFADFLMIRERE